MKQRQSALRAVHGAADHGSAAPRFRRRQAFERDAEVSLEVSERESNRRCAVRDHQPTRRWASSIAEQLREIVDWREDAAKTAHAEQLRKQARRRDQLAIRVQALDFREPYCIRVAPHSHREKIELMWPRSSSSV